MRQTLRKLPRILLTSGGSLVGQNLVQALAGRRENLVLMATNSEVGEPALAEMDRVFPVPPTSGNEEELALIMADLVDSFNIDLVIPCRDEDVLLLARLREARPDLEARILAGRSILAEICLDKLKSADFSLRHGLPFAESCSAADREQAGSMARRLGFPLIIKPRRGFASRGVRLILNQLQLDAVLGNDHLLIQAWLGDPGPVADSCQDMQRNGIPLFHTFEADKHSVQAILGRNGEVLAVHATLHRMRSGISWGVQNADCPRLQSLGARCAEVFAGQGWVGPLNIQCQRRLDGEYVIFEYNGRFTGATAARCLLGFDEVGIVGREFLGWPVPGQSEYRFVRVEKRLVSVGVAAAEMGGGDGN